MPSSWSIKLAGTCRPASSCRQTSPSLRCRQNAPSSIRSKMSGSSCATTGSRTASSNPTTISSTIAATLGTSSSTSPGASCPSDCANGRTGSDQWELVLAVTTTTRSEALPDVPVLSETLPGYEASTWFGIGAPKNTPAEIIERLNKEINVSIADLEFIARLANLGGTVLAGSPADFGKLIS